MEIGQNRTTLRGAARTAGVAYLMMMATPFAEFYVLDRLVVHDDMDQTAMNILANQALFRYGIAAYLFNFVGDLLAAWALFVLLKPVNEKLSLLTSWFRLMYTLVSLAALLNLNNVLPILNSQHYSSAFTQDQLYAQAYLAIGAFRKGWSVAYLFFAIHLWLLGYLIIKSGYIPRLIGVLMIIAGTGWMLDNLRPLLFPGFTINFAIIAIAGMGELILMLWLLIRGSKIGGVN